MNRLTRLASLLCLSLTTSAVSQPALAAANEERISERLDALEKENAALKQRLRHIENSVATPGATLPRAASRPVAPQAPPPGQPAGLGTLDSAAMVMDARAQDNRAPQFYKSQAADIWAPNPPSRFEVSGSLLYLQPGSGNLEYATLVSPFPIPTPNWSNQSINPKYSPAFRVGLRYIPTETNDVELNWTHLYTNDGASVAGASNQMVGPSYEIGPDSAVFKNAQGAATSRYDAVNFDAGHTFCADCLFQLRVFGGAEFARIDQTVSAMFQSLDGLTTAANTTDSLFTGAGPRLGMKGQYAIGYFQFFGEAAVAGLIGTTQSRINFSATSPALLGLGVTQPNTQSLTSPNETQVIPSFDARIGTAYIFPPSNYGQFKLEAGYQAAVYINAVNQYALTQVTTPPVAGSVGVFLATAQHLQSNFTTQGPYLTASWLF
jgi:hypothetical protein